MCKSWKLLAPLAVVALLVSSCGGGGGGAAGSSGPGSEISFSIGGTVSGLANGAQLTLLNVGANSTAISANGAFTFSSPVPSGGSYAVAVGTQPAGQTCSVSNGSGSAVAANVTNVQVTCTTLAYTISGTVSGLGQNSQVTLLNGGANSTAISANGPFSFSSPVPSGGSYAVTVGTHPTGQTCTVNNGSGAGVVGNITAVSVVCSDVTFTVSGTVSGLGTGKQVTLFNNASNATSVTANGSFSFSTPVVYNGSYAVTVGTQPTGQTCTVNNGTGAGVVAPVTTASVVCSDITFSVSGTVSGLRAGKQVTLFNNASNATTISANGSFSFSTPVVYNGSYAVTVGTEPTGQTCTVNNGSGAGVVANVAFVSVVCSDITYTVSGTVSGLGAGKQVTLFNNASNYTSISSNGSFSFSTPVVYNGSYAVTVGTQPTGQTCTVNNGSGAGMVANVTTVSVVCSDITFTVSGTVSGLGAGKQVTLFNNASNAKSVSSNGSFSFSTPVVYNGSFAVTVGTQPTGQTCTVNNGSGAGIVANVTEVSVVCSDISFTISGTVYGLAAGNQITLLNNSNNATSISSNGSFSFSTPVAYNGNYDVSIGTQPTGQTCTVTNGAGTGLTTNVSTVYVNCTAVAPAIAVSISTFCGGMVGQKITLDASASSDGNIPTLPLTFSWILTGKPLNSAATINNSTSPVATITPDVAGGYQLKLVVSNGKVTSTRDPIQVGALLLPNFEVRANINVPPFMNVKVGTTYNLSGYVSSDPCGLPLTYNWALNKPSGSTTFIKDPTSPSTSVLVDAEGDYSAIFTASNGIISASWPVNWKGVR